MKEGNKYFSLLISRLKNLSWVDIVGIAVFFFILTSSAFFLLRQGGEVIVTMRLFEREGPDFYFNLPKHFYVENLNPGMKETDELGRNALEILDVFKYETGEIYQNVYVTLKVKTVFNKKTGQHSFNGKPLLVGNFQTFRLKDIVLNGVILEITSEDKVRQKKEYIVEAYLDPIDHEVTTNNLEIIFKDFSVTGVKNYLAEKVVPGLKMVDSQGELVAEIVSVNKITGRRSGFVDSERTEVRLTLKLTAEKIGDNFYFQKLTPLIVGKKFSFVSDYVGIKPTITSIRDFIDR